LSHLESCKALAGGTQAVVGLPCFFHHEPDCRAICVCKGSVNPLQISKQAERGTCVDLHDARTICGRILQSSCWCFVLAWDGKGGNSHVPVLFAMLCHAKRVGTGQQRRQTKLDPPAPLLDAYDTFTRMPAWGKTTFVWCSSPLNT
jgi:hypothetical protein